MSSSSLLACNVEAVLGGRRGACPMSGGMLREVRSPPRNMRRRESMAVSQGSSIGLNASGSEEYESMPSSPVERHGNGGGGGGSGSGSPWTQHWVAAANRRAPATTQRTDGGIGGTLPPPPGPPLATAAPPTHEPIHPLGGVRIVISQEDGDQRYIPLYDTHRNCTAPPAHIPARFAPASRVSDAVSTPNASASHHDTQPFSSFQSCTSYQSTQCTSAGDLSGFGSYGGGGGAAGGGVGFGGGGGGGSARQPSLPNLPHPDELALRALLPMAHGSLPLKLDSVVTKVHWHAVPGAVQEMTVTKLFRVSIVQPLPAATGTYSSPSGRSLHAARGPGGGRRTPRTTPRSSPSPPPQLGAASGNNGGGGAARRILSNTVAGSAGATAADPAMATTALASAPSGPRPSPVLSAQHATRLHSLHMLPQSEDAAEATAKVARVHCTTTFAATMCLTFHLDGRQGLCYAPVMTPRASLAPQQQVDGCGMHTPRLSQSGLAVGNLSVEGGAAERSRSHPATPSNSLTTRRRPTGTLDETRSARDNQSLYMLDDAADDITRSRGASVTAPATHALDILQAHWEYVDGLADGVMKAAERALQVCVKRHMAAGKTVVVGRKVKLRHFDLQDSVGLADKERGVFQCVSSFLTPRWHVALHQSPWTDRPLFAPGVGAQGGCVVAAAAAARQRGVQTPASSRYRTPRSATAGPRGIGTADCPGCVECAPLVSALIRHDLNFLASVITTVLRYHNGWLLELAEDDPDGMIPQAVAQVDAAQLRYCRVLVYGADSSAVRSLLTLVSYYISATALAPPPSPRDAEAHRIRASGGSVYFDTHGRRQSVEAKTPTPPTYADVFIESMHLGMHRMAGGAAGDGGGKDPTEWVCTECCAPLVDGGHNNNNNNNNNDKNHNTATADDAPERFAECPSEMCSMARQRFVRSTRRRDSSLSSAAARTAPRRALTAKQEAAATAAAAAGSLVIAAAVGAAVWQLPSMYAPGSPDGFGSAYGSGSGAEGIPHLAQQQQHHPHLHHHVRTASGDASRSDSPLSLTGTQRSLHDLTVLSSESFFSTTAPSHGGGAACDRGPYPSGKRGLVQDASPTQLRDAAAAAAALANTTRAHAALLDSGYSYGACVGDEGVTGLPFVILGVERAALTYDEIDAFMDAQLPSWVPEGGAQQCVVIDAGKRAAYYYNRSKGATVGGQPAPLVSQALRDAIDCYNIGAAPDDCEKSLALARAELACVAQCVLPILRDSHAARDYKSIVDQVRAEVPGVSVHDIPLLLSICSALDPTVAIPNAYPKYHFFS